MVARLAYVTIKEDNTKCMSSGTELHSRGGNAHGLNLGKTIHNTSKKIAM